MSSFHDPGRWSQGLEQLANLHAAFQSDLSRCLCSRCDHVGVVSGTHKYYGIIYKCNCQPASKVINPETGDRIEEVKP